MLPFGAGWHRGSLSLAEGQADTCSSLAAAWVTTQHTDGSCVPQGYRFRQLSCERTAHEELCHCPGLSLEEHRYHRRELGQPGPPLCLWVPQLYPNMYLIGTCFFTGCATIWAHICCKTLQPGVQTAPQQLLFASKMRGEVAMSTEAASHAHPLQCSPRRHITCQGERLCVGLL